MAVAAAVVDASNETDAHPVDTLLLRNIMCHFKTEKKKKKKKSRNKSKMVGNG